MTKAQKNLLIQYLYGELTPSQKDELEQAITHDPILQEALREGYDMKLSLDDAIDAFGPSDAAIDRIKAYAASNSLIAKS